MARKFVTENCHFGTSQEDPIQKLTDKVRTPIHSATFGLAKELIGVACLLNLHRQDIYDMISPPEGAIGKN